MTAALGVGRNGRAAFAAEPPVGELVTNIHVIGS
jgi:hypothetical protein